jgi:hypothetical protein
MVGRRYVDIPIQPKMRMVGLNARIDHCPSDPLAKCRKGTMRGVGFDRCNRFGDTTAKFEVRPDMMDLQKPVDKGELSPFYQFVMADWR